MGKEKKAEVTASKNGRTFNLLVRRLRLSCLTKWNAGLKVHFRQCGDGACVAVGLTGMNYQCLLKAGYRLSM